jgi:glutathione S-transferase
MPARKVALICSQPRRNQSPPTTRTHKEASMKLYYILESCALAPQIVANEAGIPLEPVRVDFKTKLAATGADFLAVNPKGYVPALELDNGEVLTENAAILQYLADLKREARLAPANGTLARVRLQEALNFLATEIHRGYSPLFNPTTPTEVREESSAGLRKRYALLDKQLTGRTYLFGDEFTAADAYLFVVTRWAAIVKLDLSDYANLQAFQKTVAARPAVRVAMKAQGLMAA